MNRYITHANASQQLFDLPDVIHTVSETAQDVEKLYNRFAGSSPSGEMNQEPWVNETGTQERVNTNVVSEPEETTLTDYLPHIVVGGVVILIVWLALK